MIDTIFYFASGQSEYDSNAQALQIDKRTISFVPKTDDRGNIYKNNIRYGGVDVDLDYDAIKTVINNWFNSDDPDKPTIPSSGDGGDTPGGGGGNTDPIVPDWVDDRLDDLEDKAQHEKERIQEYINNKDLDIRNLIELMFDDYNEMIQNYLKTGNPDFQKYTFGDEDTMEWISQLGHVTDNGDGTYSVDWSSILLKVSEIDASVNRIKGALNGQGTEDPSDDTIDYEVLSSKIFAFLGEDYATNGLSSVWARLVNGKLPVEGEQFDPETATLLEWMASDVKTWSGGYWYNTNVVYNQETLDQLIYKQEDFVGLFTSEEELNSTNAKNGDWAVLTKDGKSTIWMYSNMTYTDVMSSAREYAVDGKSVLQEAAAGLHTLVEKQPDGTYKASSTLSSMIENNVDTKLASLQLETLDDEAVAALYSHIDSEVETKINENTTVTTLNSGMSALENRVTTAEGEIDNVKASVTNATTLLGAKVNASEVYTKEEIDGKVSTISANVSSASTLAQDAKTTFTNWLDDGLNGFAKFKTETSNSLNSKASLSYVDGLYDNVSDLETELSNLKLDVESGVITSADINGWIEDGSIKWNGTSLTSLKSKIDETVASISTKVSKDSEGNIESGVYVKAKNITFGDDKFPADKIDFTTGEYTINADKIYLNGDTIGTYIEAETLKATKKLQVETAAGVVNIYGNDDTFYVQCTTPKGNLTVQPVSNGAYKDSLKVELTLPGYYTMTLDAQNGVKVVGDDDSTMYYNPISRLNSGGMLSITKLNSLTGAGVRICGSGYITLTDSSGNSRYITADGSDDYSGTQK